LPGAISIGYKSPRVEGSAVVRRFALIVVLGGVFALTAVSGAIAQAPPEEGTGVRQLPASSPHWALVYSLAALGSFTPASVTIIDGDTRKVLGMLDGGLASGFAMAPDGHEFYLADTFYSRGARGDRTDVVSIYDGKTLNSTGEIVIPPKRQLTAQDNVTTAVTPDGQILLVANMTPSTSATVIDIKNRKVLGEIEMTGCTEVIPTGNRQFVSLCGDGSMMTTDFDDTGKATSQKRTAKPFFDPDKDPVYATPAVIGTQAYFLSYNGKVYPVDLSTDPATPGESWSLLSPDQIKEKWKPGGIQQLAVHRDKGLIYILMHQGGEWTHKDPSREVWAVDVKAHKRVKKFMLDRMADAIMITQDANPLMFTEVGTLPPVTLGYLQVYSASSGKLLGTIEPNLAISEHIYGM
jgi:methylamine dehydrogenase heavy chain